MKDEILHGTIKYFVLMTGSIMGEIDRFFKSKKNGEIPIEILGGFTYFLISSMLSSIEKNVETIFPYSKKYDEAIFKTHASSTEGVQVVKETYKLNKKLYGALTNFGHTFSHEAILKLANEFVNLVYENSIKPENKGELVDFLCERIQKWQHDITVKLKSKLVNFENIAGNQK